MPTWKLNTEFTFDAAHYIEGYDGKCSKLHGHTYRVRICAMSHELHPSKYLKTPDMVCDFNELKWVGKSAEKGGLDHSLLNEQIPVATTAERLAQYIHDETKKRIPESIQLTVTVWETPTSWVEYTD